MKKRLLLIGGGTIATHYKAGLENSPHYQLVALADINEHCVARNLFAVPFFTDVSQALSVGVDVAIVSTSTSTHYEITRELLEAGVDVICEKPMCNSYDKIVELCALAESKNVNLGCLFHWKYADEVMYLKKHLAELGRIKQITVHVCDDYAATPDGSISADRRGLCGAWLDSGINILSYIGELIDLNSYKLQLKQSDLDITTGQEKYARRIYRLGDTVADIIVDWRTESRAKVSEITCERGLVTINHSRQTIAINGEIVFQRPLEDRLTGHYENAFAQFTLNKEQLQNTLLLHKILFAGGEQ